MFTKEDIFLNTNKNKTMENQILTSERISNFLGIEIEGDSNGMVEFQDVTDECTSIDDFIENAVAGQCFDQGENEGYVYKIRDEDNCYAVVVTGASLSYFC